MTSPSSQLTVTSQPASYVQCDETNKRRRLSLSFLCENNYEKEIDESYINDSGISPRKSKHNINSVNDKNSNKLEKYRDKSVMNVKNLLIDDDNEEQNLIAID